MHFLGLLRMGTFQFIWIFGVFSVPMAVTLFFCGRPLFAYILALYYAYRFLIPSSSWPLINKILCLNEYPYCNSQNIVFDDGASCPKRNSKTMVTNSFYY